MLTDYVTLWWVWVSVALVLALVEILVPGNIFLGFALGALAMVPVVLVLPGAGVSLLLALFAGLSLLGWIVLRVVFKRQSSGARIVERDINEG
ncbi:NfeD family protein [Sulfitobacter sp.]|jgi:membrane protein implicated in regulation of membrane protease activity|uniref:NfeD family protein n=1 Tax=Sulfitobacter sp. TaxID=1903071 RepID=UPI00356691B3|tara:strand:+ start:3352 stop:3630 length:279 start_codon:yes stop_codon:yes gene_type:complete